MRKLSFKSLAFFLITTGFLIFSCNQREYKTKEFDYDDDFHPRRFVLDSEDSFTCYYIKKTELVCFDSSETLRVVYALNKNSGLITNVSAYNRKKKHGFFIDNSEGKNIEQVFYLDTLVFDCLVPEMFYFLRPICELKNDTINIGEPLEIDITLISKKNFKIDKGVLMIYNDKSQLIAKEPFFLNKNGRVIITIKNLFKLPGKFTLKCFVEESEEDKYYYILERTKKEFYVVNR